MKKAGNILCIILAWLLSIVLVITLMVAPMALSALSMLKAHLITDVVIDVFMDMVKQEMGEPKAADYRLTNMAQVTQNIPQDVLDKLPENIPESIPQDVLDKLPESVPENAPQTSGGIAGVLESYLGVPVSAEQVERVMTSNTVKEIINTYTGDLTNVLTGKEKLSELDAQKIKTIVNNNMNEVVQIVQELKPDLSNKEVETLKTEIVQVVEDKAEEIIQLLPKPEVVKEQIIEESPEIGIALQILEKKDTIQMALIAVPVLLSLLIFLCRLESFRGLRWLAVDMFVAGGFNSLLSAVVLIETPVVLKMVPNSALNSVISNILHAFDLALFERSAVILVAGGVLLTAYLLIKKSRAKKTAVNVEEA